MRFLAGNPPPYVGGVPRAGLIKLEPVAKMVAADVRRRISGQKSHQRAPPHVGGYSDVLFCD